MDIRSVTGKGWYSSILQEKNSQIHRYIQREDINETIESLCLYLHEPSMFDKENLKKSIEYYKIHPSRKGDIKVAYIKHIYIVLNGYGYILVYDIE